MKGPPYNSSGEQRFHHSRLKTRMHVQMTHQTMTVSGWFGWKMRDCRVGMSLRRRSVKRHPL